MKLFLSALIFLFLIVPFARGQKENAKVLVADSLSGIYIPQDLEDCFKQIDSFWSDSTKVKVKQKAEDEFTANAHFALGMWMRNNWGLWKGSRLSKYFNDKGIYHPDDMSGIILVSYHRYLNGKEISLQQQIDHHQIYWKVNKEPSAEIYPKGEKRMEFDTKYLYDLKDGELPGCLHVQSNSKIGKVWIYDYHFGWKQLSRGELKKLDSATIENREATIRELFRK